MDLKDKFVSNLPVLSPELSAPFTVERENVSCGGGLVQCSWSGSK